MTPVFRIEALVVGMIQSQLLKNKTFLHYFEDKKFENCYDW